MKLHLLFPDMREDGFKIKRIKTIGSLLNKIKMYLTHLNLLKKNKNQMF